MPLTKEAQKQLDKKGFIEVPPYTPSENPDALFLTWEETKGKIVWFVVRGINLDGKEIVGGPYKSYDEFIVDWMAKMKEGTLPQ